MTLALDKLPAEVTIYEVGPRDGLQNETRQVPTSDKIAFIDALSQTGLERIEITSFVSPRWIPQLADATDVARGIVRRDEVRFSALVPNRRGLDNAVDAGMREIAVFLSASESHNKKNINKTIDQTLKAFEEVVPPALEQGIVVRAYISTVFGCPYEGEVAPESTAHLCRTLLDMGVAELSLGDTIGVANPIQVSRVLDLVFQDVDVATVAVHFHDTQGTALANCLMALSMGVTIIDASVGGLGGCPYAPGASGNLATEDVVSMLHGMGVQTGVDLDKLVECSRKAALFVGHDLPSKYLKAHLGKQARRRRRAEKGES